MPLGFQSQNHPTVGGGGHPSEPALAAAQPGAGVRGRELEVSGVEPMKGGKCIPLQVARGRGRGRLRGCKAGPARPGRD